MSQYADDLPWPEKISLGHVLAERWWNLQRDHSQHPLADEELEEWDDEALMSVSELAEDPATFRQLVEMLVAEATQTDTLWTIGTGPLEDAAWGGRIGQTAAIRALIASVISDRQLFDVLSGAYPEMCKGHDVRELLLTRLSVDQVDWLIDTDALGRHARM